MGQNKYTVAWRDWKLSRKTLTLAGGHACCPLGPIPFPHAGDDAWPLQLVLGWALEGDDCPHSGAVAMNDLQCAKLGRKYAAALPCRTKTKQNNATQEPQVKAHLNLNQSKLLGKTKSRPLAGQRCLLCQAPAQGQNPISAIQQSCCSHPSTNGAVLILQQYLLSLLHTKHLKRKKKGKKTHQTYSMSSLVTYRFPSCLTPSVNKHSGWHLPCREYS